MEHIKQGDVFRILPADDVDAKILGDKSWCLAIGDAEDVGPPQYASVEALEIDLHDDAVFREVIAPEAIRPPIGIMPKGMWLSHRCYDLMDAVKRYDEAGKIKTIKASDLIEELQEHLQNLFL